MDLLPVKNSLNVFARQLVSVSRGVLACETRQRALVAASIATAISARVADDSASVFVYDDLPSDEHVRFGEDLLEHGLFSLPFKTCVYLAPITSLDQDASLHQRRQCLVIADLNLDVVSCLAALVLIEMSDAEEAQFGVRYDGHGVCWLQRSESSPFEYPEQLSSFASVEPNPKWATAAAFADSAARQQLRFAFDSCIGLTACLLSREIHQELIPAPERLNRSRMKKGKHPFVEHTVVHLNPSRLAPRVVGEPVPGARSSPRTHWRRGHIRRLSTGRLVPIPPTVVNPADDLAPGPAYRVHNKS